MRGTPQSRATPDESDCVGVIIHVLRGRGDDGAFLFLERSGGRYSGQWWPVAGTREPGESPLGTALREIGEETRLVPTAIYETGVSVTIEDPPGQLRIFVAHVPTDASVVLNWEHTAYQWLSEERAVEFVPAEVGPRLRELARRFLHATPEAETRVWPD